MSMAAGDRQRVTLHSSWSGVLAAGLGALLLALFAVVTLVAVGLNVASGVLAVVAAVVVIVVLFDLPVASEFDAEGVTRRAPLRHERLPWSSVTRLTRARVGVVRTRHGLRTGGLVAVRNRRSYLLVDRAESQVEFDELVRAIGERSETLFDRDLLQPPPERTPTWMYRHRKWRPASDERK